jgi:hypothetical protein
MRGKDSIIWRLQNPSGLAAKTRSRDDFEHDEVQQDFTAASAREFRITCDGSVDWVKYGGSRNSNFSIGRNRYESRLSIYILFEHFDASRAEAWVGEGDRSGSASRFPGD